MVSDFTAHGPDDLRTDVTASVKWYNPNKGFGFVQPMDGGDDAFLHVSVVEPSGHQDLSEGDVLTCDIAAGPRGPQVVTIHRVERSTRLKSERSRPEGTSPGEVVEGTVKFFDAAKGFGFIVPDDGSRDIFVAARVLSKSGIGGLEPDQRVRVITRIGHKGPMAEHLDLIR